MNVQSGFLERLSAEEFELLQAYRTLNAPRSALIRELLRTYADKALAELSTNVVPMHNGRPK